MPRGSGSSILLVRTKSAEARQVNNADILNVEHFALANLAGLRTSPLRLRDFAGKSLVRNEFIQSIKSNQTAFGVELSDDVIERLADYYELVQQHNPILHLVGPCSPEEFATRHVLESLTLQEFLPSKSRFADVGAGAGLPSIPCLIAREDLRAVLIESKEKKAAFLRVVMPKLGLENCTKVINKQFSEVTRPHVSHVTCRALDKFSERLRPLLKWSGDRELLFFGGKALRDEMQRLGLRVSEKLMPLSEQRFLFIATPSSRTP